VGFAPEEEDEEDGPESAGIAKVAGGGSEWRRGCWSWMGMPFAFAISCLQLDGPGERVDVERNW